MAEKDVEMGENIDDKEESKRTTEDLLRMSMDSVFEQEKEEELSSNEERALIVARTFFFCFVFLPVCH